jgi:hypothetical protein
MRIICNDNVQTIADQSVLSRSALLAEMPPDGCVHMPCDSKTWTTWLTDDTSQMSADMMELMLAVITARLHTLKNFGCFQVPRRARSLKHTAVHLDVVDEDYW